MNRRKIFLSVGILVLVIVLAIVFAKGGYTPRLGDEAVKTISNNPDAIFEREVRNEENGEIAGEEFDRCFKARIDKDRQKFVTGMTKDYCDKHKDQLDNAVKNYHSPKSVQLNCAFSFPDKLQGCEGEDCSKFTEGKLSDDTSMIDSLEGKKTIVKLKKGEKLKGPSDFTMIVQKPGRAKVLETSMSVEGSDQILIRGTEFIVENYSGEGLFIGCIGNHRFSFNIDAVEVLEKPEVQNWVKMKTEKGQTGFIDLKKLQAGFGDSVED